MKKFRNDLTATNELMTLKNILYNLYKDNIDIKIMLIMIQNFIHTYSKCRQLLYL